MIITASWHVTMIAWWVLYGCLASGFRGLSERIPDVAFHAVYAIGEAAAAWMVSRISSTEIGMRHSGILAWISVGATCAVFLSLYTIRLWQYAGRFFEQVTQ